jgi:hypothetical protein
VSGQAERMAAHMKRPAPLGQLVGSIGDLLDIFVVPLASIADDGCARFNTMHTGESCLDRDPFTPAVWCASCTALAALYAAAAWAET